MGFYNHYNKVLIPFCIVFFVFFIMCEANQESKEDIATDDLPTKIPTNSSEETSEGRKRKDKNMEMIYMGLNHIKSVIQMIMMGISQMLQFKGILISMVGVVIQALRLIMDFKTKQSSPAATIMLKQQAAPPSYPYAHYEGKSSAPGYESFTPGDISSAYSNPAYDSFGSYNTRAHKK